MAKTSKKRLRAAWLQVQNGSASPSPSLIIPISLTGSALAWHDWRTRQPRARAEDYKRNGAGLQPAE